MHRKIGQLPSRDIAPAMGAAEWTTLVILSILWSGSFFFYKVLVTALPPFTVVLGRVAIAAVALNLVLLVYREQMPREPRLWVAFAVMGVLNNVIPFTLFAFAETRISSGLASILNATTPVFAVLAAHALTNEKLTLSRGCGVIFGFAGVAVMIGTNAFSGLGGGNIVAEAACLAAALSYAFAGLFGRRFRGIAPLKVASGQLTASAIILVPLAAVVDAPWTLAAPGAGVWLALAGIALLSTALAYILYFRLLATAGATNLLLVTFLLPISALALGAAVLGEAVTPQALAGMALIGAGLVAIDGRAFKAFRAKREVRAR